jgi:5-amino-6-(5-phosphoribosylamino)uracil reductase
MHRLWPATSGTPSETSYAEIENIYKYPDLLKKPYVRVNFIASTNGKVSVGGRSAGLGSKTDTIIFGRLRRLADVILVGAGTARADGYRGARSWEKLRIQRRERGQAEVAPIAVVTASAALDIEGPLFMDTMVPPLILTVESAPLANVSRLAEAGAEIIRVGEERAEIDRILDAFANRNLYRVLCEGGPALFGNLIAADAVDELCYTVAPYVGGAGNISNAGVDEIRRMRLESVLIDSDYLMIRYCRD